MRQMTLCQKLFKKALADTIHVKRIKCLTRFVGSLLNTNTTLSVAEIGKVLDSNTSVKHNIKAADYFVNNTGLEEDLLPIYKGIAHFFWKGLTQVTILVDWSGACSDSQYVLQASLVGHGRSIPVYHEIHGKSEQEKPEVHEGFLKNLAQVLPQHLAVTIVTDAGFHREWFMLVLELGWDYIGRIYSCYYYQAIDETSWYSVKDIKFAKIGKAETLGKVRLGKTKKTLTGYLYTYKYSVSGKPHKKNKYPTHEKRHSQSYQNGWVIFSSLKKPANALINYYKKRMQIEQNFRDIKSEQYGVGLRRNNSTGKTKINMLYFLAALINLVLWWIGLVIERHNKQYQYQANTIKNKRVRSLTHLGRMACQRQDKLISWYNFKILLQQLQVHYLHFICTGELN